MERELPPNAWFHQLLRECPKLAARCFPHGEPKYLSTVQAARVSAWIDAEFLRIGGLVCALLIVFAASAHAAEERGHLRPGGKLQCGGCLAQNLNSGSGSSDLPILGGKPGPAAPATFLKLEAGGFILLEGGGKLKCEFC